jgi:hypothetical protein
MQLTSGQVAYGRCSAAVLSEDDKREDWAWSHDVTSSSYANAAMRVSFTDSLATTEEPQLAVASTESVVDRPEVQAYAREPSNVG